MFKNIWFDQKLHDALKTAFEYFINIDSPYILYEYSIDVLSIDSRYSYLLLSEDSKYIICFEI